MSRRPLVLLGGLLALVAAACGGGSDRDFTIGLKYVAIDLSYKDEELAAPPVREDVLVPQPVASQAAFLTQISVPDRLEPTQPTPLPRIEDCPAAGPDANPEHPATVFVTQPPAAGVYLTHNEGTITLDGAIPVTFAFPRRGMIEIKNIQRAETEDALTGPTQVITYDLFVPGLEGGTTTTYQVTYSPATTIGTIEQTAGAGNAPRGELALVRLQMSSPQGDIDFRPEPPVTIVSFRTGQGTSWNSAGIDSSDGTSMVVQGSVTQRKNIDLCGELYDTYEVVSNEHIVNLRTGLRSDTSPTDPNRYYVATNYGGLFVSQHVNQTTSFPAESGTPTIITAVYDQTFDSISPVGTRR